MTPSDHELLCDFAPGSQPAFAALVARHLDLVYTAAWRQVRSPQFAEEIAQSVFADLARAAAAWRPDMPLPPWLYTVTRRTAVDVIRREARRQAREAAAAEILAMNQNAPDWLRLEPLLDEGMDMLDAGDRGAVVLRYFKNLSHREVGAALGISDDAAQKRIARALDRLRGFFSQRGVTIGAGSLGTVLSTHAVQAAPAGLPAAIATASSSATVALVSAALVPAAKTIAMTTVSQSAIAAALVATVGCGLYEAHLLRTQHRRIDALETQVAHWRSAHEQAARELAGVRSELQASDAVLAKADDAFAAVMQSEAGRDPKLEAELKAWSAEIKGLKGVADRMPDKTIPEMRFLTDRDWLLVARDHKLETEGDARRALSDLRQEAKKRFVPMMNSAVQRYRAAHGGEAPTDIFQLTPYFETPIERAILERYHVVPPTPEGDYRRSWLIAETTLVDDEYDTRFNVQRSGGWGSASASRAGDLIRDAMVAYRRDHGGAHTADLQELRPYFKTPADAETAIKARAAAESH